MHKLAILNFSSLATKIDTFQTEPHQKPNVVYREFSNTTDMYAIFAEVFEHAGIEVTICHYDEQYLIQSFNADADSDYTGDIIIVKTSIQDNDTYSFAEFDPQNPSTDKYKYCDVVEQDI